MEKSSTDVDNQPAQSARRRPMTETCETCRFWGNQSGYDGGFCRRFPPQVVVLPSFDPAHASMESHFPYTAKAEFCGEYQERK